MNFFTGQEITLADKLLEILYILMGLFAIGTGIYNILDKTNRNRIGTFWFWISMGVVLAFGRFIPTFYTGVIIISMTIPAILKRVSHGKSNKASVSYMKKMSDEIGAKIFIPALTIGGVSILIAILTNLGALVGVGIGVVLSILIMMMFSEDNRPATFFKDGVDMLGTVGPLSMLPMLLASLGAIFTKAGVGEVIAKSIKSVVPSGNLTFGIIIYAVGMIVFTVIMGNAFAAITVMTVGIGAPFVFAYGADPALVGMLALSCGFCGTLMTPMAANFNIVPVAILGIKNKYTVIKNQVFVALVMILLQVLYMILFK